jgi:tetratricopeptide (TPR) repeat protein
MARIDDDDRKFPLARVLSAFCWVVLYSTISSGLLLSQTSQTAPPATQENSPGESVQHELSLQERADIFMARKQYADAVDYYRRALAKGAENPASVWNKLGIAYQQEMNFNAARKAYKKSIQVQKEFAEPWNNLGTTYFLQGKAKKSIKYYVHAVELRPSSASFHLNLGTAYYERKKFDKAVTEYRTALTLDPSVLLTHSAEGTVVEARSADARFFYYLAKVFASLGRVEESVRYLRRALEEGFQYSQDISQDPDFQKISADPGFVELMKNPPVPIKE